MGRSGGGGGFSSGGHGGGSHHGASFSGGGGSFRSSGSRGGGFGSGPRGGGFGGGPRPHGPGPGPRPYDDYGPGPHYYHGGPGMPPPPPPRRRYYGGRTTYVYSNGSSSGAFVTIIMLMLVLIVFSFYMQFKGGYTGDTLSDNRISEYAEDQYNTIFSGREDGLLLVVDENDNGQFKYGVKANALMDTYINSMISAYQNNYNDDLGIQLKGMLEDTLEIMKRDGISKIKSDKAFDSHCYRDDLNWIDTKNNVVTGAQEFYDATGIQFYVMFVKTRTIAKATNHSAGVFKVLIIAAAVVIVVCILFSWWKKRTAQKNKEQEDLERTLKTPLETFGSTPMDDLKAKYDNQDNNQS